MNARTARRLLMRGRRDTFWGRRCYVEVRVPLSAYPTPPPAFVHALGDPSDIGDPGDIDGTFVRHEGDVEVYTCFQYVSGGEPPADAYRVVPRRGGWSSWWESLTVRTRGGEVLSREPGPVEPLRAYVAQVEWLEDAVYTSGPAALVDFACEARAVYPEVRGGYLYLACVVKRYPDSVLRAASALARAVTEAKRAGVNVRVMKERQR